jgi:hypothetical protein
VRPPPRSFRKASPIFVPLGRPVHRPCHVGRAPALARASACHSSSAALRCVVRRTRPPRGSLSRARESLDNARPRKILADKEQGKSAFFNRGIGRALAEIEICKVDAFAPALIGVRRALSERFGYRSLVLVDCSVESAFHNHTSRPRLRPNDVVGARAISSLSPAAVSGWPQPDLSQSSLMASFPPRPRGGL